MLDFTRLEVILHGRNDVVKYGNTIHDVLVRRLEQNPVSVTDYPSASCRTYLFDLPAESSGIKTLQLMNQMEVLEDTLGFKLLSIALFDSDQHVSIPPTFYGGEKGMMSLLYALEESLHHLEEVADHLVWTPENVVPLHLAEEHALDNVQTYLSALRARLYTAMDEF